MSAAKDRVRHHPVVVCVVLTYGITWLIASPLVLSEQGISIIVWGVDRSIIDLQASQSFHQRKTCHLTSDGLQTIDIIEMNGSVVQFSR
ncbi:MAG: hypothetical protein ACETV1_01600 [Candidatus Bathyarchaeia archaeon]